MSLTHFSKLLWFLFSLLKSSSRPFLAHVGVSYLFISNLSASSLWCQDEGQLVRDVPSVVENQTTLWEAKAYKITRGSKVWFTFIAFTFKYMMSFNYSFALWSSDCKILWNLDWRNRKAVSLSVFIQTRVLLSVCLHPNIYSLTQRGVGGHKTLIEGWKVP